MPLFNLSEKKISESSGLEPSPLNNKSFYILVIIFLLLVICVLGFFYFDLYQRFKVTNATVTQVQFNQKVLGFNNLFIEKVLNAHSEIDFETRLKLESAVRDLNDEEILNAWQGFIGSKTEDEAQESVKNLLYLLSKKIKA